jgi:hypothetical protein
MLDPAKSVAVNLTDFTTYIQSCLDIANDVLKDFSSPSEVARVERELNKYPRLEKIRDPQDIMVLDDGLAGSEQLKFAIDALLSGGVLLEHACAGEATRLGLGTKYLLNPPLDLSPEVMGRILGEDQELPVPPDSLRHMSLGRRHMLQLAWDLSRLAEDNGKDPLEVLKKQSLFIIVNEASSNRILEDFLEADFYGFARRKVLFMVQKSFHGITRGKDGWGYDPNSATRLHNHGQMLMQTAMDHQVFRLGENNRPEYLTWPEYRMILGEFDDKVSFNIEDMDYLDMSLDLTGLAGALKLADSGYRMIMEVVSNDPEDPIKGGSCVWDPELDRNVMIESFQLAGLPNSKITFLNRNINHYPYPSQSLTAVRDYGLAMPITVKNDFVYFQPIQGDVNYLVKTAFVRRPELIPINSWKSGGNTPAALQAMQAQENRPGFLDWASKLTGLNI